jgi:hypothetical protein
MWIRVTADHIRRGIRGVPGKCAVALAATEAMGSPAYVHIMNVHFPDMDDLVMDLPDGAQQFASDYDAWLPVKPISFEVGLEPQMCVWL